MKVLRLALVAFLSASLVFPPYMIPSLLAHTTPPAGDGLWVASEDALFKFAIDDGDKLAQPRNTKNRLRLAIDPSRKTLWAYGSSKLFAYNENGQQLLSASVPAPNSNSRKDAALAVNSTDGTVWLAIKKSLHHFSLQGQRIKTVQLSNDVVGLSFDPVTGKLWVATKNSVRPYDNQSIAGAALALGSNPQVKALAVDRGNGAVWVALSNSLRLFSSNGAQLFQRSVNDIEELADNGAHGVWAAKEHKLQRYSPTLQLLLTVDMDDDDDDDIVALAGDTLDQSVWVASEDSIVHMAADGRILLRIPSKHGGHSNYGHHDHDDDDDDELEDINDIALMRQSQGNRAPVAVNDAATTLLNTTLPIQVLANDSDPDNDPLTITAVTQPAHGTVTNTNTIATYTPATGYFGLDSFTYTISDGHNHTATATVNISVNQAPAITSANAVTFIVGTAGTFAVTTTGFPVPTIARGGVALPNGVTFVNNGNGTGTLSGTAAAGTNGTYALTFTASNGVSPNASQNFTLTVNSAGPVNRPPTITTTAATTATVGQLYSYDVDASDPDTGDVLTFSLDTFPSGMTINSSTGVIQWTPSGPQLGVNNVTVRARDLAGLFAIQSFTVQVNPAANGTPFFTSAPPTTATVGQLYGYDADASDPEGEALTFSLDQAPTGMTIDPNTGLIQWTPGQNQLDGNSVVVRVRDVGGRFANQAFVVQVNATPTLPPIITSTPVTSAAVGKPYGYNVIATDPDAVDTITYSLNGAPLGMTINSTTGAIAWTPVITQTGAQNVTAIASDGRGGTAAQTFSITVSAAQGNRAPTAQDDLYAVRRGDTLTVGAPGVLQNDSDPDGQNITSQLVAAPAKGVFNFAADGSFNYTPAPPLANSTEPQLKFSYSDVNPAISITRTQPIVIDLDKDGVPEIVFISQGPFGTCKLIALHGNDGSVAFSLNAYQPAALPPIVLCDPFTEVAAGDIDGDGFPEIIAVDGDDGINVPAPNRDIFRRQLIALNHDGTHKWTSEDILSKDVSGGLGRITTTGGFRKPLIADLDGDGTSEILVGYSARVATSPGVAGEDFVTAFDNQGRILWIVRGSGSSEGASPANGTVIVQDIDLDGRPEILYSDDVYDNQGNRLWSAAPCPTCSPRVKDVVVANLDDDPFAEVVYFDVFGQVYVYEHTGALKWGPLDVGTADSALTVGDVDGDGKAEIVVTSGTNIVVIAGDGSSTRSIPVPLATIFDGSRNTTIFDLNGDGKPELIHQGLRSSFDTASQTGGLYIFDGATGALLHSIRAVRGSGDSGPVVADVNGDGSAEIVTGGWNGSPLLHVFEGKNGPWAKARPIYNQYSYNVTNVNSDGTIPAHPAPNWLTPGLNNFLVNMPLPEERTADKDLFTYKANDGALDSNTATARIDILPPNHAPNILSQPPTVASPNIEYLYAVRAFDADVGEALIFTLPQAPAGMTIDPATGLVRWTPSAGQIGRHTVALKVTDSQGEFAYQGFAIEVVGAVIVPAVIGQTQAAAQSALTGAGLTAGTIVTAASSTVPAGQVISQGIAAGTQVPAGSAVSLVISSGAQTATVPNVIGLTQAAAQSAINGAGLNIGLVATAPSTSVAAGNIISQDPAGGTPVPLASGVNLIVSLGTINLTGLSSIVVEPATAIILVGEEQAYSATGVFNDGTSQNLTGIVGWSSSAPAAATISPVGIAKGLIDGNTTIQASANAITGSATLNVRARVADGTLPNAAIVEPANNAEVTSPVDVVGNATDANFLKYVLEYAVAGETNFTVLTESAVPVTNGVLGKFDPTMLINDQYTLRLTVYDRGGNTQQASVNVQVARDMKVGLFTVTFQDLNVAVSGLPITVNRTYDSRDKRSGDFGFGWRLNLQTMRIRTNRVLGTGWVRNQAGAVINLTPTDAHKVSVTLPDGRVEEFDMQVSPTSGLGALDFTNVVGFTPRAGTVGKLEALGNNGLLILNAGLADELVDDGTLNTYNPQLFRYTTAEGTQIEIHRTEGVKKVTDLNGNTLTFGPNGITHSSGKGITFTRDPEGRITQITDPAGNIRTYAYDGNGDLISATDQVGNIARYKYNRSHGLIDIMDPAGNHAARNEYDANGRLLATIDANGNRIEFTHNLSTSQEIVRDRLGNVTVFEYDAAGNVASKTDALGHRTNYTHDGQGNQLTETDPLGRTASKTYDVRRNVLTSRDFDGNTTTNTYNALNQVLVTTDPEGRTTTNIYDVKGNLTQITDPEGGVTRHTYDVAGNRLTTTDPLGNVTRSSFNAFGNKTSEVDPVGTLTTLTYDTSGNVLSSIKAGTHTTQFQYDAAARLIKLIDALGQQVITTYSLAGDGKKPASVTDARGQVRALDYDARGNLIRTGYSDGSADTAAYDAENRVVSKTDRDGRSTSFEYDALGRQTKNINPDGTSSTKTYDAVGRALTQMNERGSVTTYSYAPNKQTVTDAIGNATAHEFDSKRRRIKATDALGNVVRFVYDSVGNLLTTTFPDGTAKITSYDAAKRKIAETDQAGRVTQFAYDAAARLVRVTDAAGSITTYTYDALGNRISQTDGNNHTTQMTYDLLGRVIKRTRPLGQFETFTYDANGNQLSHTDFNGQAISYTYDANNRQVAKILPGGTVVSFAYTPTGLRTAAGGDAYVYDAMARLVRETKANGDILIYTYDPAGNRSSVTTPQGMTTSTYDALNRLATVVDPTTGTTSYGYDAVGNLASTAYPNGVTTTYAYDNLNRLNQMINSGPSGLISSYSYTLGAVGNRLQVVEAGPATIGRSVFYSYDSVYRLTQEVIDEPGATNDQTIAYTYDAVSNRMLMNRSGVSTAYTYDANDRLVTEASPAGTSTSTFDANGNLKTRGNGTSTDSYNYDAENRLVSANIQTGANPGSVSYTYDADGMRTSKTAGGIATTFLLDKNRQYAQVLVESTASATVTYSYGHGLISQTRPGTGARFYQYDGQLSTRQLTNTTGGVTDTYSYDAFGVLLSSTGSTPNLYLYTGEQLDPNVGFYYLRARYYNQATGRFISTDPEEGNIFDPVSLHRYLYANANPVTNWDPSGRSILAEQLLAIALRGALYGGLSGVAVSLSFTAGRGETPTVGGVLLAFGTGAFFGAISAVFGPGTGIAAASVPTLITAILRTAVSIIEIHKTRNVYISDVELQGLAYSPLTLSSGAAVNAGASGTKEGAFLVLVVAAFNFIAGFSTKQFSEFVKDPLLGRSPNSEAVFWYKENKYPQPIKEILAAFQ